MTDEEDTYRNDHRLNSRPLDVHRWSDHPEVKQLIDQLWDVFVDPLRYGSLRVTL